MRLLSHAHFRLTKLRNLKPPEVSRCLCVHAGADYSVRSWGFRFKGSVQLSNMNSFFTVCLTWMAPSAWSVCDTMYICICVVSFIYHVFVCINVRNSSTQSVLPLLSKPFLVWDVSCFDASLLIWTSIVLRAAGALRLMPVFRPIHSLCFNMTELARCSSPVSHRLDCYNL